MFMRLYETVSITNSVGFDKVYEENVAILQTEFCVHPLWKGKNEFFWPVHLKGNATVTRYNTTW